VAGKEEKIGFSQSRRRTRMVMISALAHDSAKADCSWIILSTS
jgi:hypothetical protein